MDPIAEEALCSSYRTVAAKLMSSAKARGMDLPAATKLAAKIASLADRELRQLSDSGVAVACRAACNACCQNMPIASGVEVAAIFDTLGSWSPEDLGTLRGRLETYAAAAEPHRASGYLRFRMDCPFLVDGLCAVYERRPMFCRGLTSEDPDLCVRFNEDPETEQVFGPNGETRLAHAFTSGLSQGFAVEVPFAILELLKDPGRLTTLLAEPGAFSTPPVKAWMTDIPSPHPDPIATPSLSEEYGLFVRHRRSQPLAEILHLVSKPTTRNALARITMPAALNSAEEMEYRFAEFERAIDQAADLNPWSPAEAFAALADLRPISAAYQPMAMRPAMSALGRLLHDRVAAPLAPELLAPMGARKPGPIRVGLLGGIGNNSGANWALGWVRGFDRRDFHVTVLKTHGRDDSVACLFREAADAYFHLSGHGLEIARFIRSLDLDYLIYPELGDTGAVYRQAIFRLARRQATAWGGPFTSGLPMMDDYLSSELMERPDAAADYTENLVRLANTGLTLPPPRWPKLAATRERWGLPAGFLVSFPQSIVKWLPSADDLLGRISERVENPIVFFEIEGAAYETQVFKARLARNRVKALWLPGTRRTAEFRAILSLIDVALDAPGWSGGLTAMHALSFGTPVVTLPGHFLRQRLAAGFALAAGAPALLARDENDYVDLATSPSRLGEAMASLASDRLLTDKAPIRALENHIRKSV